MIGNAHLKTVPDKIFSIERLVSGEYFTHHSTVVSARPNQAGILKKTRTNLHKKRVLASFGRNVGEEPRCT
jgi:hypothetical protein